MTLISFPKGSKYSAILPFVVILCVFAYFECSKCKEASIRSAIFVLFET